MTDKELLEQFLSVASRASEAGKKPAQVVGVLEMAKTVIIQTHVQAVPQNSSGLVLPPRPPGIVGG